ncbi:MAG: hypothetical protein HGB08_03555 [Candidatus Moranbacteria bacterium]|nr:hypothetical protein [Candidatus Moranbacteria bacterium]
MNKKTKMSLPFAVLVLAVFVVGCSFGKPAANNQKNGSGASTDSSSKTDQGSMVIPENADLPKPTGKIDDVTGAIMDDANKEQSFDSSEADSAKSAAATDQDINDISNSYDQNAL